MNSALTLLHLNRSHTNTLTLLREKDFFSFLFNTHYSDVGGMLGAISVFQPTTKTTRTKRKQKVCNDVTRKTLILYKMEDNNKEGR